MRLLYVILFGFVQIGFAQKMPDANKKVVDFVTQNLGKKIDRGECWDLAKRALEYAQCDHLDVYIFGTKINPKTDSLLPGDIIQFEEVRTRHEEGNTVFYSQMAHHTAIIYEVINNKSVVMAEQNADDVKKVQLAPLDFRTIVSGRYYIYRPKPI